MASRPTGKKRSTKQKVKARYSKAREDAQLLDIIETTPEGAIKDEVADPATQGTVPMPGLIGVAMRNGWATPEHKKPVLVDELVRMVEDEMTDLRVKVVAVRTLQQGDKDQWERDNPEAAGKVRGGVKIGITNEVNTNVTVLSANDVRKQILSLRERPDPIAAKMAELNSIPAPVATESTEEKL